MNIGIHNQKLYSLMIVNLSHTTKIHSLSIMTHIIEVPVVALYRKLHAMLELIMVFHDQLLQ